MKDNMPENKNQQAFDLQVFINQFDGALRVLEDANLLGKALGESKLTRIFFVGCGASYFMMNVLAYWINRCARNLEIRLYYSAEFLHQDPLALDEETLVILASHSGKTAETVAAAMYLSQKPCRTVSITQEVDSPLGSSTNETIAYGPTEQGYFSSYILCQALVSALVNELEDVWVYHDRILGSLPALPAALAEAKKANQKNAVDQAKSLRDCKQLYVIGAGPMFTTAYTFASCFLMEMQRMHAHPLVAAEFFHGPFEVVDKSTPLIVLVGEDPSRPEAERVVEFCKRFNENYIVYDSREYPMGEIPPEVRPLYSPFVVDAALTSLVEQLAVVRQHPLELRRYMGKVDY
jgi:fructoselysine 6-phosphate deglycase